MLQPILLHLLITTFLVRFWQPSRITLERKLSQSMNILGKSDRMPSFMVIPAAATSSCGSSSLTNDEIDQGTNDVDASNYDPEMLASLPEDLRKEILNDELKQREEQRLNIAVKLSSRVGAHNVDIPAGYDPETFSALPEYMQNKIRDDASRWDWRK